MNRDVQKYVEKISSHFEGSDEEKQEMAEELKEHLLILCQKYRDRGYSEKTASALAIAELSEKEMNDQVMDYTLQLSNKLVINGAWLLFIVYMFVLFIKLFWRPHDAFWTEDVWNNINLIPFKTITMYATGIDRMNLDVILTNLLGNIAAFMPFGFFLGLLIIQRNVFRKAVFSSFILSVIVECFQFILQVGQTDVDDVILNTLGGCIGIGIYLGLERAVIRMKRRKLHREAYSSQSSSKSQPK